MPRRVLFIEDGSSSLRVECSSELNFVSECAPWNSPLSERLRKQPLDLVVAVAVPGPPSVHNFFQWLAKTPIGAPTLAVLSEDDNLLRAAAMAVDDFIVAPFHPGELQHRVARLLGSESDNEAKAAAHERLTQELALAGLVGRHPTFLHTIGPIPAVARWHTPILITGETGTGKELCARAIHHLSSRRHFPFIPVDCAALPEHLLESEMFGHARGAFTDAHRDQKGLVALAGDGTLFLDEVDSLSITAQSKLLRLLQERTYRPVGSERFVPTGARIMAACNQDLERLVQERKFRADLFFQAQRVATAPSASARASQRCCGACPPLSRDACCRAWHSAQEHPARSTADANCVRLAGQCARALQLVAKSRRVLSRNKDPTRGYSRPNAGCGVTEAFGRQFSRGAGSCGYGLRTKLHRGNALPSGG